ncbi:MAG: HNH endonuclease [Candidatus Nitrosotenuis sp.]|nr:HNH endonuclease [Candidatus Nitrosotenuis sp.]
MSATDNPLGFDKKNKRKKLSKAQKQKIAKGQDWICDKCKKKIEPFTFDIHHRDGSSSNNSIGNLAALCVKCHREVTQKQNREKDTKKNDPFDMAT